MPLNQLRSILTLSTLRGPTSIKEGDQRYQSGALLVVLSGMQQGEVVRVNGGWQQAADGSQRLMVEDVAGCKRAFCAKQLRKPYIWPAAAAAYAVKHAFYSRMKRSLRCTPQP